MQRTHRATRAGLLTIFALASSACAGRTAAPSPFEEGGNPTILITVDNQDFRDATIFVNWNGVRQRVGMVIGKTTETLRTEWRDYVVRLEVDFVGGGEMKIGDGISVQPGEHIDFVIMPGW
jgi:hypothetical protein